jgi:DNA-binding transcriptional LysR family regulator
MRSRRWEVPPLELLPAFEAAARQLSFTRAGEELFLTQSAVSRQIQALEDYFGAKLFERRTRALALTETGQQLYRDVRSLLQGLHDGTARLRGAATAKAVTVTTTPGFASLWLIPRLAGFTRTNPGVDVRISVSYELVNLERSGMDIAVRYASPDAAGQGVHLFEEDVLPVCSPALAKRLARPADLGRHVLLHLDDARTTWLEWALWLHALGLEELQTAGSVHFSHYDQLIQAAVDGQGVALGRLPLVRQMLKDGRLVAPFRKTVASSRGYYLLRSERSATKPEVGAFVAWLLEETRKDSPAQPARKSATRATRPVRSAS